MQRANHLRLVSKETSQAALLLGLKAYTVTLEGAASDTTVGAARLLGLTLLITLKGCLLLSGAQLRRRGVSSVRNMQVRQTHQTLQGRPCAWFAGSGVKDRKYRGRCALVYLGTNICDTGLFKKKDTMLLDAVVH